MNTNPIKTPDFDQFAWFMTERHRIFLKKKEGLPFPWTDDPILSTYRFCNVFRELDTTTIWIREHIREAYADHKHLWFMLCIARYVNRIPTLYALKRHAWPDHASFDPRALTRELEQIASLNVPVYTGAYMIRAESDPKKIWYTWTKHRYIAEVVLGRLWARRDEWEDFLSQPGVTLQATWAKFQDPHYVGWGPFMAYEVVTDLRHTRYLKDAKDIYTWANAGPGAIRGLNRLYGRELNSKPDKDQCNEEMKTLLMDLIYTDDLEEVFGKNHAFEMRDVEHTLCEFDKYQRVALGQGRPRAVYVPGRGY